MQRWTIVELSEFVVGYEPVSSDARASRRFSFKFHRAHRPAFACSGHVPSGRPRNAGSVVRLEDNGVSAVLPVSLEKKKKALVIHVGGTTSPRRQAAGLPFA